MAAMPPPPVARKPMPGAVVGSLIQPVAPAAPAYAPPPRSTPSTDEEFGKTASQKKRERKKLREQNHK
jgi:hypothetical protein